MWYCIYIVSVFMYVFFILTLLHRKPCLPSGFPLRKLFVAGIEPITISNLALLKCWTTKKPYFFRKKKKLSRNLLYFESENTVCFKSKSKIIIFICILAVPVPVPVQGIGIPEDPTMHYFKIQVTNRLKLLLLLL